MARRKYQGVTAYVGMPGSGKTYGLAQEGVKALRRGREVWSNAGFDFGRTADGTWLPGCRSFGSFEELVDVPAGVTLLIDEAPLYFNARKWQEFPDGFMYRLTQVRKDGLEVFYSTIDWRMVDAQLRRMTFWVYECRAVTSTLLRRSKWPPEERRKKDERPRFSEWVRVRPEVASLYDTHRKVAVAASSQRALPNASEVWAPLGAGDSSTPAPEPKAGAGVEILPEVEPARQRPESKVRLTIPHPAEAAG